MDDCDSNLGLIEMYLEARENFFLHNVRFFANTRCLGGTWFEPNGNSHRGNSNKTNCGPDFGVNSNWSRWNWSHTSAS